MELKNKVEGEGWDGVRRSSEREACVVHSGMEGGDAVHRNRDKLDSESACVWRLVGRLDSVRHAMRLESAVQVQCGVGVRGLLHG